MLSKAHFSLSKSKVIQQHTRAKKFADIVSYSYKTNSDVGKILKEETKCMFSIHSIESLKELNSSRRVWYFGQAWDQEELKIISNLGVNRFVVDNSEDLNVLLEYIIKKGKKIELLLRMKLKEHTIHTGKHFVYGLYSKKINEIMPQLRKNKNISKLGIHFHRKTQNVSEWSLKKELINSITKENLERIDYINIGGGLPAEYKNFRKSVIENIFKKILELKEWLSEKNIKMIIEPGRFIAASPVRLEANIKSIYENNIIIDCSVYNSAMDTFVANIRLLVEDEVSEKEGQAYTIKGCTPDSMDIFRYRAYLKQAEVGQKIVFLNAGAYNYASDFCNLPKLDTVVVD